MNGFDSIKVGNAGKASGSSLMPGVPVGVTPTAGAGGIHQVPLKQATHPHGGEEGPRGQGNAFSAAAHPYGQDFHQDEELFRSYHGLSIAGSTVTDLQSDRRTNMCEGRPETPLSTSTVPSFEPYPMEIEGNTEENAASVFPASGFSRVELDDGKFISNSFGITTGESFQGATESTGTAKNIKSTQVMHSHPNGGVNPSKGPNSSTGGRPNQVSGSRSAGGSKEPRRNGGTDLPVSSRGVERKIWKCEFLGCSKRFARKYNLTVHSRRHTGERPYTCVVAGCNKKFKWRSSMAHHNKMHEKQGDLAHKLPIVQDKNKNAHFRKQIASMSRAVNANTGGTSDKNENCSRSEIKPKMDASKVISRREGNMGSRVAIDSIAARKPSAFDEALANATSEAAAAAAAVEITEDSRCAEKKTPVHAFVSQGTMNSLASGTLNLQVRDPEVSSKPTKEEADSLLQSFVRQEAEGPTMTPSNSVVSNGATGNNGAFDLSCNERQQNDKFMETDWNHY